MFVLNPRFYDTEITKYVYCFDFHIFIFCRIEIGFRRVVCALQREGGKQFLGKYYEKYNFCLLGENNFHIEYL